MALRSHFAIVDSLIALQYTRVRALEDEFHRNLVGHRALHIPGSLA
jgi:hypothetical protein